MDGRSILDRRDLEILGVYCENPRLSQEEVARKLRVSQPSVALRLKKLRSSGLMVEQVGVDPFKAGLYLAKLDITTTNASKILRMFRGCPYFVNGFITSGRSNLCVFFAAEDISTLEAIVDNHLRTNPEVQSIEFNIVIGAARPVAVPVRLCRGADTPPCETALVCRECQSFREGRCIGCPVTGHYRGWLIPSVKSHRAYEES